VKLLHLREIFRENGLLYLQRWAVRTHRPSGENGWRVYLHRFLTGDGDGHHNHPWRWSFSIVLRGSYTEEYLDFSAQHRGHLCLWPCKYPEPPTVRTRRVRWFNWIPAHRYHRITELHGNVWTLFCCGPVAQGWGFWMPGRGHVPFKTRLAERGIGV
jgi:hypothetical protein